MCNRIRKLLRNE